MPRGRRLKLNSRMVNLIAKTLGAGNTREAAAAVAGIGTTTLYRWLAEGEVAQSGIKRDLWAAVKKSEAAAEIGRVALIQKASHDSWQAAAWWLERRFPDRWGRKDRVEFQAIIRREAERISEETGISADEIIAAAETILGSS